MMRCSAIGEKLQTPILIGVGIVVSHINLTDTHLGAARKSAQAHIRARIRIGLRKLFFDSRTVSVIHFAYHFIAGRLILQGLHDRFKITYKCRLSHRIIETLYAIVGTWYVVCAYQLALCVNPFIAIGFVFIS
jgi:hypothetical protein